MSDPMSDLTFRPPPADRPRPTDPAWEAVVREELMKLRRRSPAGPRVFPATRERVPDETDPPPPAA